MAGFLERWRRKRAAHQDRKDADQSSRAPAASPMPDQGEALHPSLESLDADAWARARETFYELFDEQAASGARTGESVSFDTLEAGERVYNAGQIRAQEDIDPEQGMFVAREPWEAAAYLCSQDPPRDGDIGRTAPPRVFTSLEVAKPTRLVRFPEGNLNFHPAVAKLSVPNGTSFERCKNAMFRDWAEARFGAGEDAPTGFCKPIDSGAEILLTRPADAVRFASQCPRAHGEDFAQRAKRQAGLCGPDRDEEIRGQ